MWFYFTSAERRVIITIVIVVALSALVGTVIKKFPFLRDLTNLLESQELYPRIDVNKASYEQLLDLPYVGEKTARAIVEYRKNIGRFNSIDDLASVKGVSSGNLPKFKMYLKVK